MSESLGVVVVVVGVTIVLVLLAEVMRGRHLSIRNYSDFGPVTEPATGVISEGLGWPRIPNPKPPNPKP